MINQLEIIRFKRFSEFLLPMKQLTLLTGLNSSGKSTVIHALLILRQAFVDDDNVALNGQYGLNLGTAGDILNRSGGLDTIELGVRSVEGGNGRFVFIVDDEEALHLQVQSSPEKHVNGFDVFSKSAPAFTYLSAERLGPRDVLSVDVRTKQALDVGNIGEYTAHVLAHQYRYIVQPNRCAPNTINEGQAFAQLGRQVEVWMGRILGLQGVMKIKAQHVPDTNVSYLRFQMPGERAEFTRPANLGFGVSYALPIVVAGLIAPAGGLLIVENPEAHLHPAGQSAMGEFLAYLAADGVQVVIETHSDHVLNGVRLAVATATANLLAESVAIHFFGSDANGLPSIWSPELQSNGQVSEWPEGFFDQSKRDLGALVRVRKGR